MCQDALRAILSATALCLVACQQSASQPHEASEPGADALRSYTQLMHEFTAGYYRWYPAAAVNSGLHEYDGRLPDFSPEGIRARVAWFEAMRGRTAAIDAEALEAEERLYRDYLAIVIDTELFNIQTLKVLENNAWYDYLALDPSVYLTREYAPLIVRMDAYTRHMEALPAALAAMQRTLEPMPSGHASSFEDYLKGLAKFVTLTSYEVFAGVDDPARQAAMKRANDRAAAAFTGLAQWIEALPRNEAFALGAEKYAEFLWTLERIDAPIEELKALAERDLERNLQSLRRACESFAPGSSLEDCRVEVASRKPADGPVAAATRQLARLKQLVLERDLVSIPVGLEVVVAEAPPQWSASVYISVPGPYEKPMSSIFYLSPPDPSWSPEEYQKYAWSEADLMSISTHVWSGDILVTVRSNLSRNPLAMFTYSYAYTEGWSTYCEEMMLHEALDDDPEMAVGQLQAAMLGNVGILASIGLHTGGMSVEEAEQLYRERAFADPEDARQRVLRATFDPGYMFYSLGKLMVRKLRDDWLASHPASSLRDFHEAFLSYGNPPIALLRKVLLGDADDGRLFH